MAYAKTAEGRKKSQEYQAQWYKDNKSRYLEINKKSRRRYKQDICGAIQVLKENTPCTDCGKFYRAWVMEFDHVRGVKYDCISSMLARSMSMQKILDEIVKCDLCCANCHRERTHKRFIESQQAQAPVV